MDTRTRVERMLNSALALAEVDGAPPRLVESMRYAVLPGGARVRPRLCLAVAMACGEDDPTVTEAAAAAIELIHCASLVHDDLPCFDDADLRRGKPSVHRAYGEDIAVLTGDALIVLAFQTLAQFALGAPRRLGALIATVAAAAGAPHGIVAGQAWESEPKVALLNYERAKTGSLFAAATAAGAIACGADGGAWRAVGALVGEAFQVADDILDVYGDPERLGKPVGQDIAHGRPSVAREFGLSGAKRHFEGLIDAALDAIPTCPGAAALGTLLAAEARQFVPQDVWQSAA